MANTEDDMDKPVTKRELHEALDLWSGALEARLEARFEAKFATKLELADWGQRLSAELAQHTNRVLDSTREMMRLIEEKFGDLPRRVAALEAGAPPPPKRQRRR